MNNHKELLDRKKRYRYLKILHYLCLINKIKTLNISILVYHNMNIEYCNEIKSNF